MIGASNIPLEGALRKEGGVEQILFRGCGGLGRDIEMELIHFTIALGEEGGVEWILFRGCGGLRRDIEMEAIFSILINGIIYYIV